MCSYLPPKRKTEAASELTMFVFGWRAVASSPAYKPELLFIYSKRVWNVCGVYLYKAGQCGNLKPLLYFIHSMIFKKSLFWWQGPILSVEVDVWISKCGLTCNFFILFWELATREMWAVFRAASTWVALWCQHYQDNDASSSFLATEMQLYCFSSNPLLCKGTLVHELLWTLSLTKLFST